MTKLLRVILRALRLASPRYAAWLADRLFCTPPRSRATPEVRRFLRTGRRFELVVAGRRVVGWRWGEGPAVLLVHGWGSRGGRLGAYSPVLLAAGYSVVTFDAPGHGDSGWGISSMPEFARSALAVARVAGPLHAVVAHSLGGAATALAMRWGLDPRRVALIAPPAHPPSWVTSFAAALGLGPDVIALMQDRMERRLRVRWADLDVVDIARDMTTPLLVVHDRDDQTVSWSDGAAIAAAWRGATLVTTQGLGHRDVARDPEIVRRVAAFVVDGQAAPASAWLEEQLFNRPLRWRTIGQAVPQ